MIIKKIPFIFCIIVIVLAILILVMDFSFVIVPFLTTIQDHLAKIFIIIALTIMTAPAILAGLYSILCIKKPSSEKMKKAAGYILIYPVLIVVGQGYSLNHQYGLPVMLILATLAAYFFWIAICRMLMKHQEYIQEPIISFWTRNFNRLLAFELFTAIGHIFNRQLITSKDHSMMMMLSPILFLLVPLVFYKILEIFRMRIYLKTFPEKPSSIEENT